MKSDKGFNSKPLSRGLLFDNRVYLTDIQPKNKDTVKISFLSTIVHRTPSCRLTPFEVGFQKVAELPNVVVAIIKIIIITINNR